MTATKLVDLNGSPFYPECGDLFGFSGRNWTSAAISLGTYGLPFWGRSHVAIVGRYGDPTNEKPALYESTTLANIPCLHAGGPVKGVQVHPIESRLDNYKGRIWYYQISKWMDKKRQNELSQFLYDHLGTPYDAIGAIRSGGRAFGLVESWFREEDLHSVFCSELVAAALRIAGMFSNHNASRWNPQKLLKTLVKDGVHFKPRRVR